LDLNDGRTILQKALLNQDAAAGEDEYRYNTIYVVVVISHDIN
jgi:hypothetical protein